MQKTTELYDQRNEEKKKIEVRKRRVIVKRGEIRLCEVGVNLGSEISKDGAFVRPVLILKTGIGGDLVMALPLTTKQSSRPDHCVIFDQYREYGVKEMSYFVLNQAKPISIKRLKRKINNIDQHGIYIPSLPDDLIFYISSLVQKTLFCIKYEPRYDLHHPGGVFRSLMGPSTIGIYSIII